MDARRRTLYCVTSLLLTAFTATVAMAQGPHAPVHYRVSDISDAAPPYEPYRTRRHPASLASNPRPGSREISLVSNSVLAGEDYTDCGAVGGCTDCLCTSSCCCKPWHIVTGVEATYLRPELQDTGLLHIPPTLRLIDSRPLADLDDYYAAPRVWLGMESCKGNGIRARYWHFDASSWDYDTVLVPVAIPAAIDVSSYNATNQLEAYTIDLEYTRRFELGCWQFLGSIGGRHAKLDRGEMLNSQTTDLFGGPTPLGVSSQIISEREMNATGLTLGLEGIRPLKHWGLNFFWNARGSVLWGENRSNNVSTMYVAPVGLGAGAVSTANVLVLEDDDTLYIVEAQVGVEWRRPLKCCCAEFFLRAAFEYQYWDAEEISGDYFTRVIVDVDPINFGETRDMRTHFIGMAFSAGIAW